MQVNDVNEGVVSVQLVDASTQIYPCDGQTPIRLVAVRDYVEYLEELLIDIVAEDTVHLRLRAVIRDERSLRGHVSAAIMAYPGRHGLLAAAKELFTQAGRRVNLKGDLIKYNYSI